MKMSVPESLQRLGFRFVDIPSKSIEFEDGTIVDVEPFSVSKRCTTVAAFEAFVRSTGYVLQSEKLGKGKTFRLNELIEHVSPQERLNQPAFCVSFVDAIHFCQWAKVRLPTEAEWLAGSLIDMRIYPVGGGQDCPWMERGKLRVTALPGYALRPSEIELTGTCRSDGLVVARSGPWYFREADWREVVEDRRHFLDTREVDLVVSFRVCLMPEPGCETLPCQD
jgi:hypothetical protein